MKNLAVIFVCIVLLTSCSTAKYPVKVPDCVDSKIEEAKSAAVQNPPLEVWEWKDNSNTYYYFTAPCCDQFTTLYDTECNVVCAPDGGFTGKGDGKCPEFDGEITKTFIWKDDRGKNSAPVKTNTQTAPKTSKPQGETR